MAYCCSYCSQVYNLRSDKEKLLRAKGLLYGNYSSSLEAVSEKYGQAVRDINNAFGAQYPESATRFISRAQSAKEDALLKIESRLGTIDADLARVTAYRDAHHRARNQQTGGGS
jgi:hypothetical protein